jgi:uncharacterized protein YjbJ (UPF0337 family)
MGSKTDQIKSYANEAGLVKLLATTGCEQKALRSAAKGDAQKAVGKAKGAIKDVADEAHRKL